MVVDHIDQNRNPVFMAGLHKPLESIRAAERGFNGVGVGGIVSPGTIARKFVHRHQFHSRNAQCFQIVNLFPALIKGGGQPVFGIIRAHMQFINDQIVVIGDIGCSSAPVKGIRVIDDGVPRGIDHPLAVGIFFVRPIELELIFIACARSLHID